jgi:hypothetical protein
MDYDSDSEAPLSEEIYDRSDELDEEDECVDGMYCIGTVFKVSADTNYDLLMEVRVHREIFLEYPYDEVENYAFIIPNPNLYFTTRIELLKIRIIEDAYYVLIKSFWLRILQRTWKKVFKERQEWLNRFKRNVVKNVFHAQKTGVYTGCPSYRGCLFVKRY